VEKVWKKHGKTNLLVQGSRFSQTWKIRGKYMDKTWKICGKNIAEISFSMFFPYFFHLCAICDFSKLKMRTDVSGRRFLQDYIHTFS